MRGIRSCPFLAQSRHRRAFPDAGLNRYDVLS